MKKNQVLYSIALIFAAGVVIYSCSKDKTLILSDNPNQPDDAYMQTNIANGIPLSPVEQLGKNIYFDKISVPNSMACADCHAPSVGFTGPMAGINIHGAVYRGADAQNFGDRKPPSAAYATFSPILHFDEEEGLFIGGNFWDGRATAVNDWGILPLNRLWARS